MSLQIRQLDEASFDACRQGLIALLIDAVANGASVGFLADIDAQQANEYFNGVKSALASGALAIWVAEEDAEVLGSVQLSLCLKPNGLNRGEVQKLLVLSSARRRGIARLLMQQLEAHAGQLQRGLLYLDTEAGSDAENLYRALGYTSIGGLPDYACGPDGQYRANAIYYKTLFRP
ncbi:GNAT family N-acetyltransferase [Pseudomonas fulva]|uniref:GCN5-related N-acetyltransferase n=1 Tax=Pseudomonas fulva (strain 12-X) TaxID=743720 RepID=F6AJU6_PSEF1|nr:GNAT family N-acetyltransferase [Pseudomonas fulva]AEF24038.1 GCN5-related N-acetyltransferase [Pseudomonas fulva 12-X]